MDKIFDRFVQNADKINETWQIVEFFENEFEKFKIAAGNYEADILKEQEKLKTLRAQYIAIQDEIKNKELELKHLGDSKNISINDNSIDVSSDIQVKPLEKVKIVLKDGVVVKANPAVNVYPQELYEQYAKSLIEVKTLRAKLNNSDLENARLRNEIKEIKAR